MIAEERFLRGSVILQALLGGYEQLIYTISDMLQTERFERPLGRLDDGYFDSMQRLCDRLLDLELRHRNELTITVEEYIERFEEELAYFFRHELSGVQHLTEDYIFCVYQYLVLVALREFSLVYALIATDVDDQQVYGDALASASSVLDVNLLINEDVVPRAAVESFAQHAFVVPPG